MDKSLKKNIAALLILQKANYILPFIIVPYLTRVLGPENFGKISFVQAIINYFLLITDYGFNMSATQQVAIHRNDPKALNRIFWNTTFSKILLASVSFLVLAMLLLFVPGLREDAFLYIITFAVVLQSICSPVWFLQGIEKTELIIPISIIPKVISLALIFVFVRKRSDYAAALIIQSLVSFFLSAVICIWIFHKKKFVQWYSPKFAEIKSSVYDGWHIFLSTAAISLYTTSNIVLLGIIADAHIVGYFAAADKLIKGIQSLIFTIGQAAYPRINSYRHESKEKAVAFLKTCLKLMSAVSIAASAALFIFAAPIVNIVFGARQYGPTITLIKIMSLTPFIVALSYVAGILGLLSFGFKKTYSGIYVVTGLLSLCITVPLAWYFNMYGVASSIVLTEIIITVLMFLQLHKNGVDLFSGQKQILV